MAMKLPGWARDERASLHAEAEPYRTMTPERRGQLLALACADAMAILAARSDADRIKALRDPLDPATVELLRTLRARSRGEAA